MRNVHGAEHVVQLPEYAGNQSTPKGRAPGDNHVGYEFVEKCQPGHGKQQRHQCIDQSAKASQLLTEIIEDAAMGQS